MNETLLIEMCEMITLIEERRQDDKIQCDMNLWCRKPIKPKKNAKVYQTLPDLCW